MFFPQNDLLIVDTEVVNGLDGREIFLRLAGLVPPEQSGPAVDDELRQVLDPRVL